jgi:hypothetical protein
MDHVWKYLSEQGVSAKELRLFAHEPQPTYLFEIPGSDAIDAWDKLNKSADDNAMSPIILGDAGECGQILQNLEIHTGTTPDEIIEKSLELDVAVWLDRRREESDTIDDVDDDEWPEETEPHSKLTSTIDHQTGETFPTVVMALVPTPASWEAAAYLRFGGWNDCPNPEEHVAAWRRWNQIYGAEIVCMTNDVIEARVKTPPGDRETAMALAIEHYAYCADIVDQGVGSVLALAAILLDGETWFFWWD